MILFYFFFDFSFSQRVKLTSKIADEYESVKNLPAKLLQQQPQLAPVKSAAAGEKPADGGITVEGTHPFPTGPGERSLCALRQRRIGGNQLIGTGFAEGFS